MGAGHLTAALGLVLAIVAGLLIVTSVSSLQTMGEAEAGAIGTFFTHLTPIFVYMVSGVLACGTLIATVLLVTRR